MFVAVEELGSDRPALDPQDEHHVARVLRLRTGDRMVLCDGHGRVRQARFVSLGEVESDGPIEEVPSRRPEVHVIQALAKGRKLDDVVQMLVEAGVQRITPVAAARSVTRLEGERASKASQRWEAVARAAAGQSRRAWLPTIDPVTDVTSVAESLAGDASRGVVAHVVATTSLRAAVEEIGDVTTFAVAVGPEGGWTEDEVRRFAGAGLVPVNLGPSVLRTEHAAFAAVAALSYAYSPAD